jgi:D-sedoheptulose 7-phosphate isomerase
MARNGWNRFAAPVIRDDIAGYWRELAELANSIDLDAMEGVAKEFLACLAREKTVFVIGNGGSAATASHFACDLAKGTRRGGPPTLRVIPLTDNVPLLTAWANDTSYDRVFVEQLVSLARPGDLLVAISASGNSPNVVLAAEAARRLGLRTVAWTGRSGGRLARLADVAINVPADRIELVEDGHLVIAHSLCVAVGERIAERAVRPLDEVIVETRLQPAAVDLSA